MSECPICYEVISSETGSVNLSCSHQFHLTCITSWFAKQGSCPCCRKLMGEKEAVPLIEDDSEGEDAEDHDDEEEPAGVCTNVLHLTRQELADLIEAISPRDEHDDDYEYMSDYAWEELADSYHYTLKKIDGVDCIRFTQDELKMYIIERTWKDLPLATWNELLKKKMETVTLTHSEFVALQYKITKEHNPLGRYKWQAMLASDLYIKGEPNYIGEIPICFTYFHLAATFLHSTGFDLKWRAWREIHTTVPVTGAFLSASLDLAGPLRLPPCQRYHQLEVLLDREITSYHNFGQSTNHMFTLPYDNL